MGIDWSQRAEDQPFFAQVHIGEPHREFDKSTQLRPNAPIPPYYPDHPVTRADWANYLTTIEELDRKVGSILSRLEAEGELDNTLIIFFGDHGRPHIRGKQWLYDGGLHTPLIISWPKKIKAAIIEDKFASLLDLMPTTLAAAGLSQPNVPGLNLLASDWQGHNILFAARDRCGDAVDRIRSVRTQDFKYIRNFRPDLPYLQHSGYKKLSYPVLTVMKVIHADGRWSSPFMSSSRPQEELYDLRTDPHEMNNIAANPAYAEQLAKLRDSLDTWMIATKDQGASDEATTVDMDALMKGKWAYYQKTMKQRGLDPDISDQDYLNWWMKKLGLE